MKEYIVKLETNLKYKKQERVYAYIVYQVDTEAGIENIAVKDTLAFESFIKAFFDKALEYMERTDEIYVFGHGLDWYFMNHDAVNTQEDPINFQNMQVVSISKT